MRYTIQNSFINFFRYVIFFKFKNKTYHVDSNFLVSETPKKQKYMHFTKQNTMININTQTDLICIIIQVLINLNNRSS